MNQYGVDSEDPRARFVVGVDDDGRQRVLVAVGDWREGERWSRVVRADLAVDRRVAPYPVGFIMVIAQPDTVTVEMPREVRDSVAVEAWFEGAYDILINACRASRDAEANQ